MGILDSASTNDRFTFADTDGFGESATYKPKGGSTRGINVEVTRGLPPEITPQGVTRYPILVWVANSSTYGISSTELDTGADRIAVAFRHGGSTQDFLLGTPETQDAGGMTFRLYGTNR